MTIIASMLIWKCSAKFARLSNILVGTISALVLTDLFNLVRDFQL